MLAIPPLIWAIAALVASVGFTANIIGWRVEEYVPDELNPFGGISTTTLLAGGVGVLVLVLLLKD